MEELDRKWFYKNNLNEDTVGEATAFLYNSYKNGIISEVIDSYILYILLSAAIEHNLIDFIYVLAKLDPDRIIFGYINIDRENLEPLIVALKLGYMFINSEFLDQLNENDIDLLILYGETFKNHHQLLFTAIMNIKSEEVFESDMIDIVARAAEVDPIILKELVQGSTPKSIIKDFPLFRSQRPAIRHNFKFLDIGYNNPIVKPPSLTEKGSGLLFNKFIDAPDCFCLIAPTGFYENVYIPVLRYGINYNRGVYGSGEIFDPQFTWYYVEPESELLLHGQRALITRNKITAMIILLNKLNISDEKLLDDVSKILKIAVISRDRLRTLLMLDEEVILNYQVSNHLKDIETGENALGDGVLDYLDTEIYEAARSLNIDLVILTQQPGAHGRLVSECLDTRPRLLSVKSLFKNETGLVPEFI